MQHLDPEQIVIEHKADIVERSDVDTQSPGALREHLYGDDMEDWGDGWFVNAEMVKVDRDAHGNIRRTTPLSELRPSDEEVLEGEPIVGRTSVTPTPLTAADREKVVFIMASKLFKWYASQAPDPTRYNPIYDGIPDLPPQAHLSLQPMPGTNLYPASATQVLEWLKQVIGKRAQITNNKIGRETYRPSLSFKRSSV